ncbi:MAG: RHS repeat-associated core domain-containing protein [Hyphomicrobiaceae bacterium]|nr:RHS repeat-associated core domain-containing protein [Hyphomicrobiaceae bacterium]
MHYNWHRHYDPSLGRYTQADPLGFVDGPSVYGYARNNPYRYVDRDGRNAITLGGNLGQLGGTFTPIPGGAAIGRCIGMAAGAAIIWLQSQTNKCQPCVPPVGTQCYKYEKGLRKHNNWDVHYHTYRREQLPAPSCACIWKKNLGPRTYGDIGSIPEGIVPCSIFADSPK